MLSRNINSSFGTIDLANLTVIIMIDKVSIILYSSDDDNHTFVMAQHVQQEPTSTYAGLVNIYMVNFHIVFVGCVILTHISSFFVLIRIGVVCVVYFFKRRLNEKFLKRGVKRSRQSFSDVSRLKKKHVYSSFSHGERETSDK